ncbi:MAG: hypothetical protein AB7R90_01875 [Reyranellaceae bacterium]
MGRVLPAGLLLLLIAGAPLNAVAGEKCPYGAVAQTLQPGRLQTTAMVLRQGSSLRILVVGTLSSSAAGLAAGVPAYPEVLREELLHRRGAGTVELRVDVHAGDTAAAMLPRIRDAASWRPSLLVWQTGSVDAALRVDPAELSSTVEVGVALLRERKIDVVLIGPQFSRRSSAVVDAEAYADAMALAARGSDVPYLDRYALMRIMTEQGRIALNDSNKTSRQAGAALVHACIGRVLAESIVNAR